MAANLSQRFTRRLVINLPQPVSNRLAKLGSTTTLQLLHGIDQILQDDIYVASYPRSGNTWTRFILAYLIHGTNDTLDSRSIDTIVPDVYYSVNRINQQTSRRLIKIHEPVLDACPRVIYVHRDYREALVSYWHFMRRKECFAGTFSEFVRSPATKRHGSWKQHIKALNRRLQRDPSTIHVIGYDQLRNQFQQTIERLVTWSGIGHGVDLQQLEQRTAMETVASSDQNDAASPFRLASGTSFFVDRGKGLNWRSVWSDADLRWLQRDGQLMELMASLGYS